jgi:hypothetical protein
VCGVERGVETFGRSGWGLDCPMKGWLARRRESGEVSIDLVHLV